MMKRILLAVFMLASAGAFAQTNRPATEELEKELRAVKTELQTLQSDTKKLKKETATLQTQLKAAGEAIESLKQSTQSNTRAIRETAEQLGVKISTTEEVAKQRFQEVDRSVSQTTLYAVIGILGIIVVVLIFGLLYWFMRKRQQTDKSDMIDQLSKTKSDIEENLVGKFGEEIDLLIKQLEEQKNTPNVDHSLALKVASEINLIERNISLMSEGTKGLKQLKRSVGTLKDNLAANGYDVPLLLGKEFHEGMKVTVSNAISDDSLEKDAEVITKVIIPQVNYNGKMIQSAEIEISVGPKGDGEEVRETVAESNPAKELQTTHVENNSTEENQKTVIDTDTTTEQP
jgi:cell division septum initiation protein DivIVA